MMMAESMIYLCTLRTTYETYFKMNALCLHIEKGCGRFGLVIAIWCRCMPYANTTAGIGIAWIIRFGIREKWELFVFYYYLKWGIVWCMLFTLTNKICIDIQMESDILSLDSHCLVFIGSVIENAIDLHPKWISNSKQRLFYMTIIINERGYDEHWNHSAMNTAKLT